MENNNHSIHLDTQYQVAANEYSAALNGVQTVIIVNLAISMGILAAMTAILTNDITIITSKLSIIGFSILSFIGLLGTICSIQTLHIARIQIINIQKRLVNLEENYFLDGAFHKNEYYKPLHITLGAFWIFAIIFIGILAISLLKLLLPNMINFLSILITIMILSLVSLGLIKLSDMYHKYKEINLLK